MPEQAISANCDKLDRLRDTCSRGFKLDGSLAIAQTNDHQRYYHYRSRSSFSLYPKPCLPKFRVCHGIATGIRARASWLPEQDHF